MAGSDFDEFFRMHFDPVARALTLTTGSRELAADATQGHVHQGLRTLAPGETDGPTRRLGLRRGDERRQAPEVPRTQSADAENSSGQRRDREVTTLLLRAGGDYDAAATVSTPAVVLRFLADLTLADVAEAMDYAVGTVKATLHQALQSLRVEFEETDDED